MPGTPTDEALLAAIAGGDDRAFAALYDRHCGRAYGLARSILRDHETAEEVVQDVFLRTWRQAATFDPARGNGRAWLLASVHHAAISRTRGRWAHERRAVTLDFDSPLIGADDPATLAEVTEQAALIQAGLARLAAAGVTMPPREAFGEADRLVGQGPPPELPPRPVGAPFDIGDFVRRAFHEIWNWRLFGKVEEYYAPNYRCHAASDRELYGRGDFMQDIMSRIAAFPDAVIHIDDLYWNDDGDGRYRTAVLWTLLGTHTGPSPYGPPTGRRVCILGITNHIVRDGKFVEEWSEWGEFNLLKQLTLPLQQLELFR